MDREMRKALAQEIAFLALGMKERQFKVMLCAGDQSPEDAEDFLNAMKECCNRKFFHDYEIKGSNEE